MSLTLVLGGGGITGAAWEAGMLKGLRDAGADLTIADLIIGTSAGSMVGAVVAAGRLDDLYERQIGPVDYSVERAAVVDIAKFAKATGGGASLERLPSGEVPQAVRARLGQLAVTAEVHFSEEDRLRTMRSRLGFDAWPERRLMIIAVACDDGALAIWTKDSEVPLNLAVASSCAAPFVYPPATIRRRRYIDGGIRSPTNADLAAGSDRVVIVSVGRRDSPLSGALKPEIEALEAGGTKVAVIEPNAETTVVGPDALDPAKRRAAAEAGYQSAAAAMATLGHML